MPRTARSSPRFSTTSTTKLWQADQGVARAAGSEVSRSPAQRRADALVEMARRSATAPEGGRRPRPLAHIVVGYETGCTIGAPRCAVHHIVAHHHGGPTRLANLLSLCDHHHRLLHDHGFTGQATPDGTAVVFIRPDDSQLGAADLTLAIAS